jgi:uncharacterized RDD family membrane protein YckC
MICPHCAFPNDPGVSICIKCRKAFNDAPTDALAEVLHAEGTPLQSEPMRESTPVSSGRDTTPQSRVPAAVRFVWVAGFWLRLLALLIDVVAVTGVMSVMVVLSWLLRGGGAGGAFGFFAQNPKALLVLVIIYLLLVGTYMALFTLFGGQSLGQILLGLQVIHEIGQPLTTTQVLLRMLGMVLAALPGLAGFIWVGFDLQRRGWHDYIGQTLVVRLRPPTTAHKQVATLRDLGA